MGSKMLIDASHAEETRVVVVRDNRIEEFDFESASRKQLKGNIYLAKVTRVEPSLQAAFVDYGGNRHGFLAFSEIHPDYYQIPVADRQALLREQEEDDAAEALAAEHEEQAEAQNNQQSSGERQGSSESQGSSKSQEASEGEDTQQEDQQDQDASDSQLAETPQMAPMALAQQPEPESQATANRELDASEAPASLHSATAPETEASLENAEQSIQSSDLGIEQADPAGKPAKPGRPARKTTRRTKALATPTTEQLSVDVSEILANPQGDDETNTALSAPLAEETGQNIQDIEVVADDDPEAAQVESLGAEDAMEEVRQHQRRSPRRTPRRQYKIQEVIKRRQIILVQVVKEERGNKGAALTTYLSLAGRYCVLMPNTARGGGISRKITDAGDRRRLKEVARDVEVPQGMGLIVRTAGAQRTRPEIKRDFDYLMRLWENVRDMTLHSTAPALVYEEGSIIKRSIRDLYNKDVEEVFVEGDNAYREARDFMKMLMPSHAKNVKQYKDQRPLFSRHQIETQLDQLYSPAITLPAGGYLVMNQTEALVAIDINSGKATREHNIEDTALKTNLEACDEIARQLRLRDLAGLVVIDFIDMEENRNNRAVERRLKDALKNDRARIQVGRISHFGLMEMSRQRLRPGLLEGSSCPCPHCEGRGVVRSVSSSALSVLRGIEDHLMSRRAENVTAKCAREVAFYILNEKRESLLAIENTYGISIFIIASDEVTGSTVMLDRAPDRVAPPRKAQLAAPIKMEMPDPVLEAPDAEMDAETQPHTRAGDDPTEADDSANTAEADGFSRNKRRRRGRRGGRRNHLDQGEGEHDFSARKPEANTESDETTSSGLGHEEISDAGSRENTHENTEIGTASPQQSEGESNGQPPASNQAPRRRDRWGRLRKPRPPRSDSDQSTADTMQGSDEQPSNGLSTQASASEQPDIEASSARPHNNSANAPASVAAASGIAGGSGGSNSITEVVSTQIEPRKWQPPKPTAVVEEEKPARRLGWWSKRS